MLQKTDNIIMALQIYMYLIFVYYIARYEKTRLKIGKKGWEKICAN